MVGSRETELPLAPSLASAGLILRDQGMPTDELHVVLTSEDAEIVRRYLAFHVERMEERLVEQRRRATWAEQLLTMAAAIRHQSLGDSLNAPSSWMPNERSRAIMPSSTWRTLLPRSR
jgi:hypothetical protein